MEKPTEKKLLAGVIIIIRKKEVIFVKIGALN